MDRSVRQSMDPVRGGGGGAWGVSVFESPHTLSGSIPYNNGGFGQTIESKN